MTAPDALPPDPYQRFVAGVMSAAPEGCAVAIEPWGDASRVTYRTPNGAAQWAFSPKVVIESAFPYYIGRLVGDHLTRNLEDAKLLGETDYVWDAFPCLTPLTHT